MCGILGQVNRRTTVDRGSFKQMLATLSQRGPDQSGVFFDRNIALGHQRLAILDITEAGRQPMNNESDDVVIVFNGEIYNYHDVKGALHSRHIWKSKTDTEVLVHGYEEYGQRIVEMIEGMFAFAIYDKEHQIITLARDHFGKKPLYYYYDENTFCFASEMKALLVNSAIKERTSINALSLQKYLFYGYVPAPESMISGIKKLEPSSVLQFDIRQWKIISRRSFWCLSDTALLPHRSENEILSTLEKLLEQSVHKRLMSDVPLGIFLSGGVDSTVIAGYLAKFSPHVNSFTVCYRDQPGIDEAEYARRVAQQLGIQHHQYYLDSSLVQSNFLGIMDYLDEPLADAAIIPLYFISQYAKKKITVVLSGDGGDEIFAGYTKYKAQKKIETLRWLCGLATFALPFTKSGSALKKLLTGCTLSFAQRQFIFGSGSLLPEETGQLLVNDVVDLAEVFAEAEEYASEFHQTDIINRSLYLDCKIQLPDWYLVKGDRATMAASLEMRNPLLDRALAEFMFSIPGALKMKGGESKYFLKKIACKFTDPSTIYRPKKGFAVPLNTWIRRELKDLFSDYLFLDHGYFNRDYIATMYREHCTGRVDRSFALLRIFNFNYWYRRYYG